MNDANDALDAALRALSGDAVRRPELIARLCAASLHVIGQGTPDAGGSVRVAQLRQDGQTIVPVFTSPALLAAFTGGESPAITLEGDVLFRSCGDQATFVINPGSGTSLTLTAAEAAAAGAATSAPAAVRSRLTSEQAARILRAIHQALAPHLEVRRAYAGNLVAEGQDRLMIGLDLAAGADPDPAIRAVSAVLRDAEPADATVDLVLLDRSPGPITDALRAGEPFFQR